MTQELTSFHNKRAGDKGWLCWLAVRFADMWDFFDRRNIDLHATLIVTLVITIRVMEWAMDFGTDYPEYSETKVALVIGAVIGPWALMQTAMFAFYTNALGQRRAIAVTAAAAAITP